MADHCVRWNRVLGAVTAPASIDSSVTSWRLPRGTDLAGGIDTHEPERHPLSFGWDHDPDFLLENLGVKSSHASPPGSR